MDKTYTWEEIKDFLSKELKKTKHILTYGTIGSCNIEHDIDTIITKKPSSKASEFYKEVHSLFDKVDIYLKEKHGSRCICFSSREEEIKILSKYKKKDLLIQLLIYTSYNQLKGHWEPYMFEEDSCDELIKKHYSCILGDKNKLFEKEFQKKKKMDSIFLYLNEYGNYILSNLSEKHLLQIMNHHFDFIMRKRLHKNISKAKLVKEVRDIFYQICDILEK